MPLLPITLPPGVAKAESALVHEGRWIDMDQVRFSEGGFPKKIGGWLKQADDTFLGICRALHTWRSNSGVLHTAIGTHKKLYVFASGAFTDITPLRATDPSGTLGTDPFSMTNGSAVVEVTDVGHAATAGSYVWFDGATAAGGITIDGMYEITEVIDADTYTITHSAAATSTTTGGGAAVDYDYEIAIGTVDQIASYGYGVGGYGEGLYGTPRTESTLLLEPRIWSLDNGGEDLIATYQGGMIYKWDLSAGGRAARLANSPDEQNYVIVTGERAVMSIAADDPLTVAVSDDEDDTLWAPAGDNSARTFRLRGGSKLRAARPGSGGWGLIWSDEECFVYRHRTTDQVYDIVKVGSGAGVIAPHAHTEFEGAIYWMARDHFNVFDGGLAQIPNYNEVSPYIFGESTVDPDDLDDDEKVGLLDRTRADKIFCYVNEGSREIWWHYPDVFSPDGEPNRYVAYMIDLQRFITGSLADRTAGVKCPQIGYPVSMAGSDGYLYYHDVGTDAEDEALPWYIEAAGIDIQDGDATMDITGIIADFKRLTGYCDVTFYTRRYPQTTVREEGPVRLWSTTGMADPRISGRLVGFKLSGTGVGSNFHLGKLRFEVGEGGMRR